MKTVPFDLYSKKTGKSVTFQKNKYSELTIRQESCDKTQPYTAYVKDKDITKYSKHEWKDFTSIKESNPASIGTAAKENLVSVRAQEINAVPALGTIASKDDDLSIFAKEILKKVGLHETGEQTEQEKPLLSGYRKLPDVYKCEEQRNKLIRLVCRHPTEWNDTPKKAEVLKLNDAQKKQIKALSWWDEASGIEGLPQPQNVWHFHPAGFVGNLGGCAETFSKLILNKIFKTATETRINEYYEPINQAICTFEIEDIKSLAFFFGQASAETGDLLYKEETGGRSYFNMYEGRSDLGNNQTGDGYRFKGRGLIQLTGRSNYTKFQTYARANFSEYSNLDIISSDKLAAQVATNLELNVLASLWYWFKGEKSAAIQKYVKAEKS